MKLAETNGKLSTEIQLLKEIWPIRIEVVGKSGWNQRCTVNAKRGLSIIKDRTSKMNI